jgi:hypothetical protein
VRFWLFFYKLLKGEKERKEGRKVKGEKGEKGKSFVFYFRQTFSPLTFSSFSPFFLSLVR